MLAEKLTELSQFQSQYIIGQNEAFSVIVEFLLDPTWDFISTL
jgi:hypothetical protein